MDSFSHVFSFGDEILARRGGEERSFRGFLQPVSVTTPDEAERFLPAGRRDERRFLLIAEAGAFSGDSDLASIFYRGREFLILRLEEIHGGHWEGLLRLKGGFGDA